MLFSLAVLANSTIFLCLSVINDGDTYSASKPCAKSRTDLSEWVSILISVSRMAEVSNYINIDKQHRALNLHCSTVMCGKWMYINMKIAHSNKNGNVFLTNLSSDNFATLFSASS